MMLNRRDPREKKDKVTKALELLKNMVGVDSIEDALVLVLFNLTPPLEAATNTIELPEVFKHKWRLKFREVDGDKGYYILLAINNIKDAHIELLREWIKMRPPKVVKEARKQVKGICEPLRTILLFHIVYNQKDF